MSVTEDRLRSESVSGATEPSPLFICGTARSGTTLLTGLLDSHPMLAVLPVETYYFQRILDKRVGGTVFRAVEAMLSLRAMRLLSRFGWRSVCRVRSQALQGILLNWAESSAAVDLASAKKLIRKMAEDSDNPKAYWQYYLRLYSLMPGASSGSYRYWVEKTPSTERFVQIIEAQFERSARYIHLIRDPRDVVASWLIRTGSGSENRLHTIYRVCHTWALSVWAAAANAGYCGDRYTVVRYEDLVRFTKNSMDGVAARLSLPSSESLHSPTRLGEPIAGNSAYSPLNRHHAVYEASIGRHKEVLSGEELILVEKLLGEQMAACRYDCAPSSPPARLHNLSELGSGRVATWLRHLNLRKAQRQASPIVF